MDGSLRSANYLTPEWMLRLLEDYEDEVNGDNIWAVKLLQKEARKAVWSICNLMRVDTHGVPAQACRLLERYLALHIRQYSYLATDQEEWSHFKQALALRFPLLIATCAQLAAKMSCAGIQVSPSLIRSYLICKGIVYSLSDIVDSEFEVFSTLGYRVPLWTSMEAAQLLAVEVGIPVQFMEGIAIVVNISEYCRDRLDDRVRSIANISPNSFNYTTLRTLHLVGGAICASAVYYGFRGADPTANIARLTRAPFSYIKCISDVIITDIINEPQVETRKRRRG